MMPRTPTTPTKPKPKRGRPFAAVRRDARLSVRTYPDVAEKVARNGTEWLESLIRSAADRDPRHP